MMVEISEKVRKESGIDEVSEAATDADASTCRTGAAGRRDRLTPGEEQEGGRPVVAVDRVLIVSSGPGRAARPSRARRCAPDRRGARPGRVGGVSRARTGVAGCPASADDARRPSRTRGPSAAAHAPGSGARRPRSAPGPDIGGRKIAVSSSCCAVSSPPIASAAPDTAAPTRNTSPASPAGCAVRPAGRAARSRTVDPGRGARDARDRPNALRSAFLPDAMPGWTTPEPPRRRSPPRRRGPAGCRSAR